MSETIDLTSTDDDASAGVAEQPEQQIERSATAQDHQEKSRRRSREEQEKKVSPQPPPPKPPKLPSSVCVVLHDKVVRNDKIRLLLGYFTITTMLPERRENTSRMNLMLRLTILKLTMMMMTMMTNQPVTLIGMEKAGVERKGIVQTNAMIAYTLKKNVLVR